MIFWILQIFIFAAIAYLGWGVLYQLVFAVAGHFYSNRLPAEGRKKNRFAVFIPAYREDAVIVEVAEAATDQEYPSSYFKVIVIADSLKNSTLERLRSLPIEVIEVSFEQSTKSRALNEALKILPPRAYDIALILDADNVMARDFLDRINRFFNSGCSVAQGRRTPKNLDTPMAVLDGAAESVNNHILCAGHRALGLSARLAGSGMAFDYGLFREIMPRIDAIGGFDKELELRLTQAGHTLAYDAGALVYDEKVRNKEVFSRQRSRWIAAQFYYGRRFFPLALRQLWRYGQYDFFNKALQMWLPPRLLTPGILGGIALLSLLAGLKASFWISAALLMANLLSFALAMPKFIFKKPYRSAIWQLPGAFFAALRALTGLKKAQKQFIHTPHGETEMK